MDNKDYIYDIVLDIIKHPGKYTSTQLEEVLSDPETRDIYNLLCKTDSAIESDKTVDVDAEWERFAKAHNMTKRRPFIWRGSRAASIAIIICTSLVAIAAGIAITVAVKGNDSKPAVETTSNSNTVSTVIPEEGLPEPQDSLMAVTEPVMFEDSSLEDIMKAISATYGVDVTFNSKEVASLHLYYRLDPTLTIDEVISQLNTFEQINIHRNGYTLTID
ncbi:MAG: DUF4974 domain-containing protein [Muribaculaceae bacterium]|nr:DUF4974 domain-containing protein [Muribaculaceae bacterium]